MKNEIWKDVKGYEGIYRVSNKGRVMSVPRVITRKDGVRRRVRGGISTLTSINKTQMMNFAKDGSFKGKSIPNVMMEAFDPNFDPNTMRVKNLSANSSNFNLKKLDVIYKKSKVGGMVSLHKEGRKRIMVFDDLKAVSDYLEIPMDTILFGKKTNTKRFKKDITLVFEKPFVIGEEVIKTIVI